MANFPYSCIVADPPWPSKWGRSWVPGAEELDVDYDTLSLDQIASLPIGEVAADNAHLWLWATQGFLRPAFEVAEAWGFQPKNVLTWNKPKTGLGYYFMINTEFLIFCRRGSLKTLKRFVTEFSAPRRAHSEKPHEAYALIEAASPGPRLDVFARRARKGWDVWGDQVKSSLCLCLDQGKTKKCKRCQGVRFGLSVIPAKIVSLPLGF